MKKMYKKILKLKHILLNKFKETTVVCINERAVKMVKYETIKENFENGGCQLITTEAEMILNNLVTTSKYTIIAKCGHQIDNCWYHMFMYRNTGKKCKNCMDADSSVNNKKLNQNIDGNCYSLFIEAQSIQLIKKYLNLEIKVSPECCVADIAFKVVVIEN